MKIGIVSESPSATSGFGATCRHIVYGLARAGHEIVCFGKNAFGETFDRSKFPCRIWAVGDSNLIEAFSKFLLYENVDLLVINFDIVGVQQWFSISQALGWNGPTIAYFVLDGLPMNHEYLELLLSLHGKITATHTVAKYLEGLGIHNVNVAPHGVDPNIFRPLLNREDLRCRAGLEEKFVVGVFGRNSERKQHTRVMMALSHLKRLGQASDIVLYLHCQPKDNPGLGGWDLLEIARHLEIEDIVIFPHDDFNQESGVPYRRNQDSIQLSQAISNQKPSVPEAYDYVERLNCCDFVVNPAFCGGFELVVIEAQSCGVPIAITNDKGIMAEVAGEGAFLLEPVDVGFWRLGGQQYFVSAQTIAEAILATKQDRNLRESLIHKGHANASKYLWKALEDSIINIVEGLSPHISKE